MNHLCKYKLKLLKQRMFRLNFSCNIRYDFGKRLYVIIYIKQTLPIFFMNSCDFAINHVGLPVETRLVTS